MGLKQDRRGTLEKWKVKLIYHSMYLVILLILSKIYFTLYFLSGYHTVAKDHEAFPSYFPSVSLPPSFHSLPSSPLV